jgi:hypothetical protein
LWNCGSIEVFSEARPNISFSAEAALALKARSPAATVKMVDFFIFVLPVLNLYSCTARSNSARRKNGLAIV